MKLLYLYIPSYGILNDIELNFTGECRFSYNKETREITKREEVSNLPENFFSTDENSNSSVECISALIGNNGAGKTSIAKFIHFISNSRVIEHILIWKLGDGRINCSSFIIPEKLSKDEFNNFDLKLKKMSKFIHVNFSSPKIGLKDIYTLKNGSYILNRNFKYFDSFRTSLDEVTINMGQIVLPENPEKINYQRGIDFHFIYHTNNYTPMHQIESINNTLDISTSNLIKFDTAKFTNTDNVRENNLNYHSAMEFLRGAKFIANFYENKFENKWNVPIPFGCRINITSFEIEIIKNFNANDKDFDFRNVVQKVKDVVLNLNITLNLSARVLSAFIANQMRYFLNRTPNIKELLPVIYGKFNRFYDLIKDEAFKGEEFSAKLCEAFIKEMSIHKFNVGDIENVEKHEEWNYMYEALMLLEQKEWNPISNSFRLNLRNKEEFNDFITLMIKPDTTNLDNDKTIKPDTTNLDKTGHHEFEFK